MAGIVLVRTVPRGEVCALDLSVRVRGRRGVHGSDSAGEAAWK